MEFYFNPETGRVEQRAPVDTTGIAGMYDQVYGNLVDQTEEIVQQTPLKDLGFDTSYGVANEADVEDEDGVEKKGIAKLFEFLGNIPTPFNLARRGLESLRGANQRLRNTDFGQSKTLMEYLGKRQARKEAERLAPIQKQLQEASDRGGGYQPTSRQQNEARTASRVGPSGNTKAYGL